MSEHGPTHIAAFGCRPKAQADDTRLLAVRRDRQAFSPPCERYAARLPLRAGADWDVSIGRAW